MSFFYNLNKHSNNFAFIDDMGQNYTYAEVNNLCKDIKSYFKHNSKKLIFLLCENSIETVVIYLTCLQTNNVVFLLDSKMKQSLLQNIINAYSPDLIWKPRGKDTNSESIFMGYELISLNPINNTPLNPELNLLLSTSGSTGSPKAVRLTKYNLQANAQSISKYLKLNKDEKAITSLPIHYSYGLSIINSHLLVGATVLLTKHSVVTKEFWQFFNSEGATSFSGVPYTYEILKKIGFFKMTLHNVRYITQAGGKLNPNLVREYANHSRIKGYDFYVMYGQTEATARISYLPHEMNIEKHKSIGIPIPKGNLWIIDETGSKITESYKEGELVFSGPNVMMGYATGCKDLKRGNDNKGFLCTGDLAYFDNDDYFYITGRLKRFIKIFGDRVNLDDIENYLKDLGYKCYCGGKDDHLLIANLQLEKSKKIKDEIIKQYGFNHKVVHVIYVDDAPINSSGKIQYDLLFSNLKRN